MRVNVAFLGIDDFLQILKPLVRVVLCLLHPSLQAVYLHMHVLLEQAALRQSILCLLSHGGQCIFCLLSQGYCRLCSFLNLVLHITNSGFQVARDAARKLDGLLSAILAG